MPLTARQNKVKSKLFIHPLLYEPFREVVGVQADLAVQLPLPKGTVAGVLVEHGDDVASHQMEFVGVRGVVVDGDPRFEG